MGRFEDNGGCVVCQAGKYADTVGALTCDECPAGTYLADDGLEWRLHTHEAVCSPCPVGRASNVTGAARCNKCKPGKFADSLGNTNCSKCESGVSTMEGAIQCDACSQGEGPNAKHDACEPCAAGRYGTTGVCDLCAAGKISGDSMMGGYGPGPGYGGYGSYGANGSEADDGGGEGGGAAAGGATSCQDCWPGTYSSADRTGCLQCPSGKYSASAASSCSECKRGREPLYGTECSKCAAGRYSLAGDANCTVCPGGTYSAEESYQCTQCDLGKFSYSESMECFYCWDGWIANSGQNDCEPCAAGTYKAAESDSSCTSCADGEISEAGMSCQKCPPGTYANSNHTDCEACPTGTVTTDYGKSECAACATGTVAANSQYEEVIESGPGGYGGIGIGIGMGNFLPCSNCACVACAPGSIPDANNTCTECEAGKYAEYEATTCTACPSGTYSNVTGISSEQACLECPGKTTASDGATSLDMCIQPGINQSFQCVRGKVCAISGFEGVGLVSSHQVAVKMEACVVEPTDPGPVAGYGGDGGGIGTGGGTGIGGGGYGGLDGGSSGYGGSSGGGYGGIDGGSSGYGGLDGGSGTGSSGGGYGGIDGGSSGYGGLDGGSGTGSSGGGYGGVDGGSSGYGGLDGGSGTGSSGGGYGGVDGGSSGYGGLDGGSGTGSSGGGYGGVDGGSSGYGGLDGGSGTGSSGGGYGGLDGGSGGLDGGSGTGSGTGSGDAGTGSGDAGDGGNSSGTGDGGSGDGGPGGNNTNAGPGDDGNSTGDGGPGGGGPAGGENNTENNTDGGPGAGPGGGLGDGGENNTENNTGGGPGGGPGDGGPAGGENNTENNTGGGPGGGPGDGGPAGGENNTENNTGGGPGGGPGDGGPAGGENNTENNTDGGPGAGPGGGPGDGGENNTENNTGGGPGGGPGDGGPAGGENNTENNTDGGPGPGDGGNSSGIGDGPGDPPDGGDGPGDPPDPPFPRRLQGVDAPDTSAVAGFGTDSISSQGSTTYSWSLQLSADPGQYRLCWCGGVGSVACDTLDNFDTDVGTIVVLGPYINQHFACTKGHVCRDVGPVQGLGLTADDLVHFRVACTLDQAKFFGASLEVRAQESQGNMSGEVDLYLSSHTAVTTASAEYALCWCSSIGPGCTSMLMQNVGSATVYLETQLGILEVQGPPTGEEAECYQGQECAIQIKGESPGLQAGDRVSVLEQCGEGDFLDGLPTPGYADTVEGTAYAFNSSAALDGARYLMSLPGIFRLCWCRPAESESLFCSSGSDFNVTVGLFRSVGPYAGQVLHCPFGSPCLVTDLRGIGLSSANLLLAVADCGSGNGTLAYSQPQPVASSYNATSGQHYYDLGHLELQNSRPEQLWVCWCAGEPNCNTAADFRVYAMMLYAECPPGWYELQSATITCQECPPGYYCAGGYPAGIQKCLAGMTSMPGASSLDQCVCRHGYFWNDQLGACFACPAGFYQNMTGRPASCTGVCPAQTTSTSGAASLMECSCTGNTVDIDPTPEGFNCVDLLSLAGNFSSNDTHVFAATQLALYSFSGSILVLDASTDSLLANILDELSERVDLTDSTRASFSLLARHSGSWYVDYEVLSPDAELAEIMRGRLAPVSFDAWVYSEMEGTVLASASVANQTPVQHTVLTCPEGLGLQAGDYVTGLADCQCPHGMQPAVTGGTGLLNGCTSCPIGTYKSSTGDSICVACPSAGHVPLTTLQQGAISYAACTCSAGFVNEDPADPASCAPCGQGYFCLGGGDKQHCGESQTTNGDTASSQFDCLCQEGFNSAGAGVCEACVAGTFKEEIGNSPCVECPAGQFSEPGAEECDSCDEGTFSTGGTGSCEPCPAGRYSPDEEATSVDACVACEAGKWSDQEGASEQQTCQPCLAGSTTRQSGAQNDSLCVRPFPDQPRECISGRACAVDGIEGYGLQDGHRIGLASSHCSTAKVAVPNVANSGISDLASSNGGRYVLGESPSEFAPEGGYYSMCWCANIGDLTCEDLNSNYLIEAGELHVIGPSVNSFECVRGRDCSNLTPFLGFGLSALDSVAVRRDQCGLTAQLALSPENSVGKGNLSLEEASGSNMSNLVLSFGMSQASSDYRLSIDADDGGYALCWCASDRGMADACSNPEDYRVFAGRLRVVGPRTNQESECFVGQECAVTGMRGVSMETGDRLMILSNCGTGTALPGFPSSGIMETLDGVNFAFLSSTSRYLLSVPGIFRICFCRPLAGEVCASASSFHAAVGLMTASGPFEQTTTCELGSSCTVQLSGIGLMGGDQLLFAIGECGNSTSVGSLGYPSLQDPLEVEDGSSGMQVTLGELPAEAVPGLYRVCWCPLAADCTSTTEHRAPGGYLQVNCPAGTFATGPSSGAAVSGICSEVSHALELLNKMIHRKWGGGVGGYLNCAFSAACVSESSADLDRGRVRTPFLFQARVW